MNTRPATEADLDQVCDLADEIAALHHSKEPKVFAPPNAARDREFWRSCITEPDSMVNVFCSGSDIVGFVTAKLARTNTPSFVNERTICRIGTIVVSSTAQRRGIGTELIRSVEHWAKRESAAEIRLEVFDFNRQAISFYASLGYAAQSHIMRKGLA